MTSSALVRTLRRFGPLVALTFATQLAAPSPTHGQTDARGYIAGAVFADIRDFSEGSGSSGEEWSLDTTGVGGGVRVATFLHPRWSLELGVDAANRTTATFEEDVRILIFPPPPPFTIERSTQFTVVTAMVGYHPPPAGRVRLGYLVGYSFVRSSSRFEYPGLDLSRFGIPVTTIRGTDGLPFEIFLPRTSLTLPRTAFTSSRTSSAVTLGFEAAIQMSPRLSIVPEVRALLAGSPDVLLVRPGASVRWSF